MSRYLIVSVLCLIATPALAQERDGERHDPRSASRVRGALGGGVANDLTGAGFDPSVWALGGYGLWMSPAWGNVVQLSARLSGMVGVSAASLHTVIGACGGVELGWLSLLSIECQVCLPLHAQVERQGVGISTGVWAQGFWALHPFDDDRDKILLGFTILMTFPMASNVAQIPQDYAPFGAAALIGYEEAF